ncbi:DUF5776 domain-containing protein [Levilactobacillus fuyuanensis]|uniref:DUF5776 domain-containing protein n=1 Tax=Levilactobacillus fuyuanensis TaxID=2486022 RepID=A0ABW4H1I5_9LACO|nr:DUF5776 domain-containing protein [Levilactobacillus fuyuanensis]
MKTVLHRLTIAGLALILFTGVTVPTVVQADSSTDTTISSSTDDVKATVGIVDLPYSVIQESDGSISHEPWYPGSQTLTTEQMNSGTNFTNDFPNKYPGITSAPVDAGTIASLTFTPITLTSNKKLVDYLINSNFFADSSIDAQTATTEFSDYTALIAWIFKVSAEYKIGTPFPTIKADYETNMQDKAMNATKFMQLNATDNLYDGFFDTLAHFQELLDDLPDMKTSYHVNPSYTDSQLATLNPDASADLARKALNTPLSQLVTKNGDTYETNGLLVALRDTPAFYSFKPETDTTTTPSVTSHPVTIHYVDDQGNTLKPDKTLTGSLGDSYKAEPLTINGYKLIKTTGQESGTFTSSDQTITYTYGKMAADTVFKNSVIYATKKISLYSSPTFTNSARKTWYANKSRMNRPMFKVTGTAISQNGVKRYKVQDLNGKGTTGYVTANANYVAPLYYATKQNKITVINPKGLNAYANKALTGKRTNYKQGQVLKVTKIVNYDLTTRFVLSNGKYISANKKLVTAGKVVMPKRVQAKTAINRYDTANLTKKNKHIAKGTALKVTGWAYSNANNFRKGDILRYKVAGGYITANSKFINDIN